ncbi:MAG: aminodeoxychorismate/anthranilate synthase component II [Desulfuromonadaceae bacterium]|nr:aminodeoxychorismate/anthranilate synthase component II [Desulfuromonadaceae bacterium]MDD5107104.1 aminodeoxychorismate/anthranilate synthase component II [Desulfuromonadaceae bacterium]
MLLMIDNYDSFTFNIVQYFGQLGENVLVRRNDQITLAEIEALHPARLVISPGPCTPEEAGVSVTAIRYFAGRIPILGVCLGHQSIGYAFGGTVLRSSSLMHGKTSPIIHNGQDLFAGLTNPFMATRYHSLIVDRPTLPDCLEVTAWVENGEIMGLRHKEFPIWGVQFHPESILTEGGMDLFRNFITISSGQL